MSLRKIKTEEKDGYTAVQLGFGEQKDKHTTNGFKGHFSKGRHFPKEKNS